MHHGARRLGQTALTEEPSGIVRDVAAAVWGHPSAFVAVLTRAADVGPP